MEKYMPKIGDYFRIEGIDNLTLKCENVTEEIIEYSIDEDLGFGAMMIKDQVFHKVEVE